MGVFAMPSLGADMEDGTLVEWLIAEGDTVARGDVVAVVETQKGAIEIECFEPGQVSKLLVPVGKVVPVGAALAVIGDGEVPEPVEVAEPEPEPAPEPVKEPESATAAAVLERPAPSKPKPEPVQVTPPPEPAPPAARDTTIAFIPSTADQPRATPAARVRARDLGIDLSGLPGTGLDGMIVLGDVERARAAPDTLTEVPTPAPEPTDPRAEMRKAIAAAMARSKQTIPHFYLSQTFDVQPVIDWLSAQNAERAPSERLLLGAVFLRAAARAARDCPTMNGHYANEAFQQAADVHAGLAIALRGGGLVAPSVMNADTLSLDDTMAAMRDLVSRARAGRLRGTEMTAGTITVSSLGDSGAESMGGVIFPPQVALVGLGAPQLRPWVVHGAVKARQVITLTVSVDHRVNDVRQASRYLSAFETHLKDMEGT